MNSALRHPAGRGPMVSAPVVEWTASGSVNEAAAVSSTVYGDPNSAAVDHDDGSRLGRRLALPRHPGVNHPTRGAPRSDDGRAPRCVGRTLPAR